MEEERFREGAEEREERVQRMAEGSGDDSPKYGGILRVISDKESGDAAMRVSNGRRGIAMTTGYILTTLGGIGVPLFWLDPTGTAARVAVTIGLGYMLFLGFLIALVHDVDDDNAET